MCLVEVLVTDSGCADLQNDHNHNTKLKIANTKNPHVFGSKVRPSVYRGVSLVLAISPPPLLRFSFEKFLRNFCEKSANFCFRCATFRILRNHSQTSFHPKLRYSVFALFCFAQFCETYSL